MFSLQRRAPYSDWLAQIDRQLQRRGHRSGQVIDCDALKACYDCGLTATEIADTWEEFNA